MVGPGAVSRQPMPESLWISRKKGRGGGEEREEEGEKKMKREMGRRGEKRRARERDWEE